MPLIVISGLPCSGKSSVVAALAEVCRQRGQEVQIVDEDSLHLQRNESYKGGEPVGWQQRSRAATACGGDTCRRAASHPPLPAVQFTPCHERLHRLLFAILPATLPPCPPGLPPATAQMPPARRRRGGRCCPQWTAT